MEIKAFCRRYVLLPAMLGLLGIQWGVLFLYGRLTALTL